MKTLRVMWPAVMIAAVGACGNTNGPPPPPPPAAWSIGLVKDSLTPASRLYGSPSWAFYMLLLGPNRVHAGLLSGGTLRRDEIGRFAHCLQPANEFSRLTEIFYVALGDTLLADSAAYRRTVSQLDHGGVPMQDLFISLTRGDSQAVLPGLTILAAPSFAPRAVSAPSRGATRETPVLRHWAWRDGGSTFAEDTTHASLVACSIS